jgi:AraC family transcriptional regulator
MTTEARTSARTDMKIEAALRVSIAELSLMRLDHPEPDEHRFDRDAVYWIDCCLTPRRPRARARYVDRWGPHRFAEMGSIMALPPRFPLHLKSEGGRHISLICAMQADAVDRWLPSDYEWTDRRLEACLNISSPAIRDIMQRLTRELRRPGIASRELGEALVLELSVELARYLVAIAEPTERGGLAMWRLRTIDKRLAEGGELPTLAELATLCSMSVRQLTRGFRTSRGCSLGEYMAQGRIEAAKRRLAGAESIKTIATSVGFSDQSTFTYAFRRATGFTPLQFRQRILQRIERGPGPA